MFWRFGAFSVLLFLPIPLLAQSTSSSTILCIPGQCLQGYSNATIGATVTGTSSSLHLLPGTYDASTNPQLLHDTLTSSSASLTFSAGFNSSSSSSISLPLTIALQPGVAFYPNRLYSGQAAFTPLPTSPTSNSSTQVTANALYLSSNIWITLNVGSTNRVVVWDAIPDVAQLPVRNAGSLSLVDIQSAACSPTCSGGGVCSAAGVCQCQPGFSGASCETCAPGFFGPTCQPCPTNCTTCDEGITGTGRCLKPAPASNAPSNCNCKSGVCGANGTCTCTPGFTTGSDGTQCAKCLPGFFLTPSGDCEVCELGCTQCADGTGQCTTCKSGFTQDGTDKTNCDPVPATTTTNQLCPDGSFPNGAECTSCSSACQTCTGGTSNDCILCASGTFSNNGGCVSANTLGVCQGTNLIADNNKHECDTCGASCTKCQIQGFNGASTADQKQCTACLPGFFLSNGTCVESCPSGTTVASQDNLTCIPCDSSCTSCSGSSTFCLTCANNQLASNGTCISNCPSSTFASAGACLACHSDCASCSGGSFNQCTSCPAARPVLVNGRCLPTCARNQFFDPTSGTCQTCDSSCASCSAAGPSSCLACAGTGSKLSQGTCVAADCQAGTSVIVGLGVCLSDLVSTTSPSGGTAPLPPVSGIDTTTVERPRRLEWWEILLMALGCAFIFLAVIWCYRRRQNKKRANAKMAMYGPDHGHGWRWKLAQWARKLLGRPPVRSTSPVGYLPTTGHFSPIHDEPVPVVTRRNIVAGGGWRWKLIRWGEKLFGHTPSQRVPVHVPHIVHLGPMHQSAEDLKAHKAPSPAPAAREVDMVKLIESYNRTPDTKSAAWREHRYTPLERVKEDAEQRSLSDASSRMSAPSLYSQLTGMPRRVQDPRLPVRRDLDSRFAVSTFGVAEDERGRGSPNGSAKPAAPF